MESIKKAIKDRGFTLEQVAAQMENKNGGKGISQPALTQMLSGNPSISRVMEIARILDMTVSELVGDQRFYDGNLRLKTTVMRCPHCHKDIFITIDGEIGEEGK